MIRRSLPLVLFLWILGAVCFPQLAAAQDPTPTPLATVDFTEIPTTTLDYTPDTVPATVTITNSAGLDLSLNAGLWDYDTFVSFRQSATTWFEVAEQYHVISLFIGFAFGALILGAVVRLLASRGDGN